MAERYTIKRHDKLERDYGKWLLVRRSLGVSSFGINIVELQPGETIPEHDERDRDQEEVYIILEGSPSMRLDGELHPCPARTYVRCDTGVRRQVVNDGDETAVVLMLSAPTTSGYAPMEWA